jgi:ABC-type branched-subunit amino acid transport system ATPase component
MIFCHPVASGSMPSPMSVKEETLPSTSRWISRTATVWASFGSNGAGKTTFLRVVSGVYPPVTGEAVVFTSARTMTVSLWAARLPPRRANTAVLTDRVWDEKMGNAMETSRRVMRATALISKR